MEPYTPENQNLMENRISFLQTKNRELERQIKSNTQEINRLQGIYDVKYMDNPAYYHRDTGNPWNN